MSKLILFQGDSITDCSRSRDAGNDHAGYGYAQFTKGALGAACPGEYRFLNRGVSGNRIVDVYARIKADIINLEPDYMSLLIGINDILRYNDSGLFRQYLTELICRLRSEGSIPVMQTCTHILKIEEHERCMERYNKLPLYNEIIRKIAEQQSIILVDHDKHWQKIASDENLLKRLLDDDIHPNGAGHLEMAKEIFRTLGIYDADSNCANPIGIPHS